MASSDNEQTPKGEDLPDDTPASDFERLARTQQDVPLLVEFWEFVRDNKKWWMVPMLLVFSILGVLVFLSGTGAGPLIYSFF